MDWGTSLTMGSTSLAAAAVVVDCVVPGRASFNTRKDIEEVKSLITDSAFSSIFAFSAVLWASFAV